MNRPLLREIDGDAAPDANEQYLLYQTLVGTWPVEPMSTPQREAYRDRIVQYMEKALREAKIHTSWMNPSEQYDTAVRDFIRDLLDEKGEAFVADLDDFVRQIADSGFVNSLAQALLKMTLPGVPDFYQGTELWDFNLVDPDNRRPIDFDLRRRRLDQMVRAAADDMEEFAVSLTHRWPDADTKLWISLRSLAVRHERPELFTFGEYIPLAVTGPAAEHIISFARGVDDQWAITVAPRHYQRLRLDHGIQTEQSVPQANWEGTQLVLPSEAPAAWRDAFSGRGIEINGTNSESTMNLAEVFRVFPVALLTSDSP
jgi:(1->4)-alpha-D-glucan 1-alpha-D-glucosylmutase